MADTPILLLIDLQHGIVEGDAAWGARSTPALESNVTALLSHWRSKDWPVVHIQHDDTEDLSNPIGATHPETFRIHDSAAPRGDEPVFVKHTGSAFSVTELLPTLQKLGVARRDGTGGARTLVVAGMDGSQCINSTTRAGIDLGLKIVVVADACASYGAPSWNDEKKAYDAETWHNVAMTMLSDGAQVTTTQDVYTVLGQA